MTEDQTSRIERKIETLANAVNEHRVSTARELGELSTKVDGIASRIGRVEDSTGQVDVMRQREIAERDRVRPSFFAGLPTAAIKIVAYIALALIGVGVCLGSRGDSDALGKLVEVTTRLGQRLERIEASQDAPRATRLTSSRTAGVYSGDPAGDDHGASWTADPDGE